MNNSFFQDGARNIRATRNRSPALEAQSSPLNKCRQRRTGDTGRRSCVGHRFSFPSPPQHTGVSGGRGVSTRNPIPAVGRDSSPMGEAAAHHDLVGVLGHAARRKIIDVIVPAFGPVAKSRRTKGLIVNSSADRGCIQPGRGGGLLFVTVRNPSGRQSTSAICRARFCSTP